MSHDFGLLRELVHRPNPGKGRWRTLCRMLEDWPTQELRSEVLPYLEHHLESWPWQLRIAPRSWVEQALEGRAIPLLRLARRADLRPYAAGMRVQVNQRHTRRIENLGERLERALRHHDDLVDLRELNLPGLQVDDRLVDVLCEVSSLRRLVSLKLCGTGLTIEDLRRLGQADFAPGLEQLHLSTQRLYTSDPRSSPRPGSRRETKREQRGDLGRALVEGAWSGLRELNLSNTLLFDDDLEELCAARFAASLQALTLGNSAFTQASLTRLLRASLLPELRRLNLSSDVGSFSEIAQIPFFERVDLWGQLTHLKLHSLTICREPSSVAQLIRSLKPGLEELSLAYNPLNDETLGQLAEQPALQTVRSLDISASWVADWSLSGFRQLVEHPHFAGIERFGFARDNLTAEFLEVIESSPHTQALRRLDFQEYNLPIGQAALEALLRRPGFSSRLRGQLRALYRQRLAT